MSASQEAAFNALFDAMDEDPNEVREYPASSDGSVSHRPPVGRDHPDFHLLPPQPREAPPLRSSTSDDSFVVAADDDLSLSITPPSSPSPPPRTDNPSPSRPSVFGRIHSVASRVDVYMPAFVRPLSGRGIGVVHLDVGVFLPFPAVHDLVEFEQKEGDDGRPHFHVVHPTTTSMTPAQKDYLHTRLHAIRTAESDLRRAHQMEAESAREQRALRGHLAELQCQVREATDRLKASECALDAYKCQQRAARSRSVHAQTQVTQLQKELNARAATAAAV